MSTAEAPTGPEAFTAWYKDRVEEAQRLLDMRSSLTLHNSRAQAGVDALLQHVSFPGLDSELLRE